MGGSSAPIASTAANDPRNAGLAQVNANNMASNSSGVQGLLSQYASGGMSLQDALSKGNAMGSVDPYASKRGDLSSQIATLKSQNQGLNGPVALQNNGKIQELQSQLDAIPQNSSASMGQALSSAIATDPMAGSMYAKQMVMQDPTMQGLYGQGGLQSQAESNYGQGTQDYQNANSNLNSDRDALSGRDPSFGLQKSDLAAYGQASGNLGRQFANQNQNMAQEMANRGLGAGPSGVSAASFAGQFGNQSEQLAGLQNQIAQNRIQTAQGLAQARNQSDLQRQANAMQLQAASGSLANGLANTGQQAIQNQFGRQLAGAENSYNQTAGTASQVMQNQNQQQNTNNAQFQQQQATNPGNMAMGMVGGMAGSLAGGMGTGLGGSLGNALTKGKSAAPIGTPNAGGGIG